MNGWREGGGTHKELLAPESLVNIPERGLLMNGGQLGVFGSKLIQNIVLETEIHCKVLYSLRFHIIKSVTIPDSTPVEKLSIIHYQKVAY